MTWAFTTLGLFLLCYGHAVFLFALVKSVENLILISGESHDHPRRAG